MAAIPTILKGDDSCAIVIQLDDVHDYTGAVLVFAYQGVTRKFEDLEPGGTVSVFFSHDETRKMKFGTYPILLRLVGRFGAEETVNNEEMRIKVTDCLGEVNSGSSFVIRPGTMAGVPITDVGDLAPTAKVSELYAKVEQIIKVLAQRSALLIACAFCISANAQQVTKETLGELSPQDSVVVDVSGGGGTNTNDVQALIDGAFVGGTNAVNAAVAELPNKLDKTSVDPTLTTNGVPADAAAVGNLPYMKYNINEFYTLKMVPAHYDGMPSKIDFTDYGGADLPYFQAIGGSIDGTLNVHVGDDHYTGINGGSISVYDGTTTTDIRGGSVVVYGTNSNSAELDADGLTLNDHNDQTTYSPSSIAYNGVGFSFPHRDGTFALDDWISLSAMLDDTTASDLAANSTFSNAVNAAINDYDAITNAAMWASNAVAMIHIDATDEAFSNAVLAVGLNIDTNSVAVLNQLAESFGGFPITGTATTVGGLLAALAAAVAWLKKNKVGSFEPVGTATATVENGVANLSEFFSDTNSVLKATIDGEIASRLKDIDPDEATVYDLIKALKGE